MLGAIVPVGIKPDAVNHDRGQITFFIRLIILISQEKIYFSPIENHRPGPHDKSVGSRLNGRRHCSVFSGKKEGKEVPDGKTSQGKRLRPEAARPGWRHKM